MKALIYARQSSGKDDVSESVEAQIQNCKRLAEKEKLEVIGIFRDLNTSGETYPAGSESVAALDTAYQKWVSVSRSRTIFRLQCRYAVLPPDPTVRLLPRRVRAFVRVRCPLAGRFLRWR